MELNEFKISVLPLRPKLLNYARKLTESPEDAEDAVQEVLLKLWNNRLELDQYRSIEAFAMTLTHNVCMDQWRRNRDNSSIDQLQTVAGGRTPDHLLELKDEVKLIRAIIDSLPPTTTHHHADEGRGGIRKRRDCPDNRMQCRGHTQQPVEGTEESEGHLPANHTRT